MNNGPMNNGYLPDQIMLPLDLEDASLKADPDLERRLMAHQRHHNHNQHLSIQPPTPPSIAFLQLQQQQHEQRQQQQQQTPSFLSLPHLQPTNQPFPQFNPPLPVPFDFLISGGGPEFKLYCDSIGIPLEVQQSINNIGHIGGLPNSFKSLEGSGPSSPPTDSFSWLQQSVNGNPHAAQGFDFEGLHGSSSSCPMMGSRLEDATMTPTMPVSAANLLASTQQSSMDSACPFATMNWQDLDMENFLAQNPPPPSCPVSGANIMGQLGEMSFSELMGIHGGNHVFGNGGMMNNGGTVTAFGGSPNSTIQLLHQQQDNLNEFVVPSNEPSDDNTDSKPTVSESSNTSTVTPPSHTQQQKPSGRLRASKPKVTPLSRQTPLSSTTTSKSQTDSPSSRANAKKLKSLREGSCRCRGCGTFLADLILHGSENHFTHPFIVDVLCLVCYNAPGTQLSKNVVKKKFSPVGPHASLKCDACHARIGFGGVRLLVDGAGQQGGSETKSGGKLNEINNDGSSIPGSPVTTFVPKDSGYSKASRAWRQFGWIEPEFGGIDALRKIDEDVNSLMVICFYLMLTAELMRNFGSLGTWELACERLPVKLERRRLFVMGLQQMTELGEGDDGVVVESPTVRNRYRRYLSLGYVKKQASKRKSEPVIMAANDDGGSDAATSTATTTSTNLQASPSNSIVPFRLPVVSPPEIPRDHALILAGHFSIEWCITERHIKIHQFDSLGRSDFVVTSLPGNQLRHLLKEVEFDLQNHDNQQEQQQREVLLPPLHIWLTAPCGARFHGPLPMKKLDLYCAEYGLDFDTCQRMFRDPFQRTMTRLEREYQVYVARWEDRWDHWGAGWEDC
ncbi:hypothetical protein HDU76_013767 [Blyttiomyces sp. JEL0837]|nr:hypothetical protein HDU76_013767 [Blyttiomyces sp. JEL0837]